MFQFILHILFTSKITYIFYPPSFDQILEANPSTSSGVIDAPIAALDAAKVSGPLGAVAGSQGWGVCRRYLELT